MPDETPEESSPLTSWSRWLIGVVELGLSVLGTIAVFVAGTNVAGVPLLVVAGAGFLYVALTGQRLIQVNKDGVVFGKLRKYRNTLHAVGEDPDITAEAKERIADVAEANGIRLPRPSSAELELSVRATFESLGEQFNFEVRATGRFDAGADFFLVNRRGRIVAVEVKSHLRLREFGDAIRQLRRLDIPDRLLVVDGGVPDEFAEAFRQENIWILRWGLNAREEWIATLQRMEFM